MNFVFGNLPNDIGKKDIISLVGHCRLSNIEFFKESIPLKHSNYECLITLDINDPVAGNILEKNLNNTCWRGSRISFHRLIF